MKVNSKGVNFIEYGKSWKDCTYISNEENSCHCSLPKKGSWKKLMTCKLAYKIYYNKSVAFVKKYLKVHPEADYTEAFLAYLQKWDKAQEKIELKNQNKELEEMEAEIENMLDFSESTASDKMEAEIENMLDFPESTAADPIEAYFSNAVDWEAIKDKLKSSPKQYTDSEILKLIKSNTRKIKKKKRIEKDEV